MRTVNHNLLAFLMLSAVGLLTAPLAEGDTVLVNSFGPDNGVVPASSENCCWGVFGNPTAQEFSLSSPATVTSATLAVVSLTSSQDFTASIYTDNAAPTNYGPTNVLFSTPGTSIESTSGVTSAGPYNLDSGSTSGAMVTFSNPVTLQAGNYWLLVQTDSTDALSPFWLGAPTSVASLGSTAQYVLEDVVAGEDVYGWYAYPDMPSNGFAMTLYGDISPVPVPASLWLMLSGLGVVGTLSRKRQVALAA